MRRSCDELRGEAPLDRIGYSSTTRSFAAAALLLPFYFQFRPSSARVAAASRVGLNGQ